jgi:glucose-1-phosphate thymidylyltransferase
MDAIILAAGYATRLHPLTLNKPKPLLEVSGRPIVDHIISKLEELKFINKIYIVTNDKLEQHFEEWLINSNTSSTIEIINDGTKSNEDRLGALGDVHYAIKSKNIEEDIMVIAGDNLFELYLQEVVDVFNKRQSDVIVLYDVKDIDLAKNYGVVKVEDDIIVSFEEKPANPESTLVSTGIYLFPKKTLPLIKKYIDEGNNADKSGSFIEWLHKRDKVYAYVTDKKWYDLGSFEQLEEASKHFKE